MPATCNRVLTFATPADMIEAMFGPSQHDAHVQKRIKFLWLKARREWNAEAAERVRRCTEEMIAQMRAERAARQGAFAQAAE